MFVSYITVRKCVSLVITRIMIVIITTAHVLVYNKVIRSTSAAAREVHLEVDLYAIPMKMTLFN